MEYYLNFFNKPKKSICLFHFLKLHDIFPVTDQNQRSEGQHNGSIFVYKSLTNKIPNIILIALNDENLIQKKCLLIGLHEIKANNLCS